MAMRTEGLSNARLKRIRYVESVYDK
jgi:hypothetical protein